MKDGEREGWKHRCWDGERGRFGGEDGLLRKRGKYEEWRRAVTSRIGGVNGDLLSWRNEGRVKGCKVWSNEGKVLKLG